MRRLSLLPATGLVALSLAALLFVAVPASAGDEARISGFACENRCPLAHQANAWRALGDESLAVASKVHADLAQLVAKNVNNI